ncbi:MAG: HigA family addiction module antitoxin [Methylovirgula sp.]
MGDFTAVRGKRAPTHPGAVLRETVLPHLNFSVKDAAERLGVTRQTLHRVLSEQSGVSPEMALRLGKFCGNGEQVWINMQTTFDLWHAKQKIGKEIDRIKTVEPDLETA